MSEVLISGRTSFKIEVPYKLIESGKKGKKPLIVYLHGYKQNITLFQKLTTKILNIEAYHLFIQAPYPVYDEKRERKVEEWGRAWYLYDGEQTQFVKSMEISSEFIQEIIDQLIPNLEVSRICIFGYSMGGYLGGYFALSRWKHVNEAIILSARIKTEVFEGKLEQAKHIRFLAIHGEGDTSVYPGPQQKEIENLKENGIDATFEMINEKHKFTDTFIEKSMEWLSAKGYRTIF